MRIKNILLNIDEAEDPPRCLDSAVGLSRQEKARLTLVNVLPSHEDLFAFFRDEAKRNELQNNLEKHARENLKTIANSIETDGIATKVVLEKGAKANKLIRRILKEDCDFLIKDPSTDYHQKAHRLGVVDRKLIRHCPCPIWIVLPEPRRGSVVVAVDAGTDEPIEKELNQLLLSYGAKAAQLRKTSLEVVYAWSFDKGGTLQGSVDSATFSKARNDALAHAKDCLKNVLNTSGVRVPEEHRHFPRGYASSCIADYCQKHEVDTLVIGSVGRTGLSGILIGNTAERVIDHLHCSFLIVTPPQVKSPVQIELSEALGINYAFAVS